MEVPTLLTTFGASDGHTQEMLAHEAAAFAQEPNTLLIV